ncbi:hypothetical protein B296_00014507 [Ensete ventricosum]|uniref:Uncharacterized protein n=1 Tax=Ensete ventricosum TaxID=4639 RepID=A0A427APT7_ENSVE|nr:hypothetical protein B296_00014507 [Ensete ventricosum]
MKHGRGNDLRSFDRPDGIQLTRRQHHASVTVAKSPSLRAPADRFRLLPPIAGCECECRISLVYIKFWHPRRRAHKDSQRLVGGETHVPVPVAARDLPCHRSLHVFFKAWIGGEPTKRHFRLRVG